MARLRLSYDTFLNHYTLRDPYSPCNRDSDYESFEMVICHEVHGEYTFKFIRWEEGDWCECITKADYESRVQDIKDNEGDEVAAIWTEHQVGYITVKDDHQVFKLRDKWLAFQELNLFDIPVSHFPWQGKPLPQEAIDLMADARDRWVKAEANNQ